MQRAEQTRTSKHVAATEPPDKGLDVLDMKKTAKQAKHMSQTANNTSTQRGKARIVALALTGVLAIGGAGAICIAGIGKSPGQAPVAAQSTTTKTRTAKPVTTQAVTKTTDQKQNTKRVSQTNTKTTNQQQSTRRVSQPAPQQQQQQSNPAPTTQSNDQNTDSGNNGLEVKVSREGAIAMACDHVGAGGQAKGEAQNVSANGPITGGGTIYYVVELDLGDVHYSVTVDAVDGNIINADQTHAGTRTLLDENGDPQEGTEQPVDA